MHERAPIFVGLLVFLVVGTFPIWYNLASDQSSRGLALHLPAKDKECVAPVAYMKTSHMKLLGEWRDRAVRDNQRTYSAYNGKIYAISLTGTCLRQCHTSRADFCDRCHAYSGVADPYCWDCHLDAPAPQTKGAETRAGEADGR